MTETAITPTIIHFLIICPLVFLGGLVDAVAGGGGLITLPAYLIAGLPVHFAIGTNKASSFMGTGLSTFRYAKKGYIPWKIAGFCIVCALIGSAAGARLALLVGDRLFKILMLFILPATAFYVMRSRELAKEQEPCSFRRTLLIGMLSALLLGAYDGFYGPGAGTFLILVLNGLAHMNLQSANGLTKAINFSTNVGALFIYLTSGKVILTLGLTAGLFSLAGNYVGTQMFEKGGARAVKPLMLVVLTIFFIRVIKELIAGG